MGYGRNSDGYDSWENSYYVIVDGTGNLYEVWYASGTEAKQYFHKVMVREINGEDLRIYDARGTFAELDRMISSIA